MVKTPHMSSRPTIGSNHPGIFHAGELFQWPLSSPAVAVVLYKVSITDLPVWVLDQRNESRGSGERRGVQTRTLQNIDPKGYIYVP